MLPDISDKSKPPFSNAFFFFGDSLAEGECQFNVLVTNESNFLFSWNFPKYVNALSSN